MYIYTYTYMLASIEQENLDTLQNLPYTAASCVCVWEREIVFCLYNMYVDLINVNPYFSDILQRLDQRK